MFLFIFFIVLYGAFQMSREAIEMSIEVDNDFFPDMPDEVIKPTRRHFTKKYGIHIPT